MIRLDAVTLKQLRALQAVATHGTLTAAAAAIGQTTPAIHSQIKNLETAVGVPVLARASEGGRMQLTPEGEEILRAAMRIEGILSQAAAQIRARTQGRIGRVALSVVSTGKYFAPRLVRMLHDRCPEIEIALKVGNRETVIADLDQGRCDLAVMGRPPREPMVQAVRAPSRAPSRVASRALPPPSGRRLPRRAAAPTSTTTFRSDPARGPAADAIRPPEDLRLPDERVRLRPHGGRAA